MSELDKVYNAAVKFYNKLADQIEEIYNEMKKKSEVFISKKTLMENYDLFIQSLLAKVAYSDGDIDKIELLFIKNISRYHDYFKKKNDQDDLEIVSLADDALKSVPKFIELFAAYEKEMIIDGKPAGLCKDTLALVSNLVYLLASIDEEIEETELKEKAKILEPIIKYLKREEIEL